MSAAPATTTAAEPDAPRSPPFGEEPHRKSVSFEVLAHKKRPGVRAAKPGRAEPAPGIARTDVAPEHVSF